AHARQDHRTDHGAGGVLIGAGREVGEVSRCQGRYLAHQARNETPVEATMSAWRFACDRYPSLVVPAPPGAARDVRFRGGVALVRDQRAADHLIQHGGPLGITLDRKSTRLNSSHVKISYAVFCSK